jgi:hypothetical protein
VIAERKVLLEAWLVVYLAGAPAEESVAVYEKAFELPVYRPGTVRVVCERGERLRIETDQMDVSARGIINATGTWGRPFVPDVPGADRFRGTQMHTRCGDNGRGPFRRGLPPASVVSVTGSPVTPAVEAMRQRGVLERLAMFSEITEDSIRWKDGTDLRTDVILWCTDFRSATRPSGAADAARTCGRPHHDGWPLRSRRTPESILVGYGPSASPSAPTAAAGRG